MLTSFFKLLSKSGLLMKKIIGAIVLSAVFFGCQENETASELTGNEEVYTLVAGSERPISGTVTFKERKDGSTVIHVQIDATGNTQHPVHLHDGTVSDPDAEVAALLTSVDGNTGKSQTIFTTLADGTVLTYDQLINRVACIKIHLGDSGPERDVILAAGNIGSSASARTSGDIAVCKSK